MSRHEEHGSAASTDSMQDAHNFYNNHHVPSMGEKEYEDAFDSTHLAMPGQFPIETPLLLPRSTSRSPTRAANRSVSSPVPASSSAADAATSPGAASRSQQQRSIKDLVNRFNQTSATSDSHIPVPPNSRDRYHRKPSDARAKLQKPRSPTKLRAASSPQTRLYGHGISNGLAAVAAPHMAMSGLASAQPARDPSARRKSHKPPLFGEVAYDPNAVQQPGYGIPDPSAVQQSRYGIPDPQLRRGSEGSVNSSFTASHHKRSRSDAHSYQLSHQRSSPSKPHHLTVKTSDLTHKRSRSDMTYDPGQAARYHHHSSHNIDASVFSSPPSSNQESLPFMISPSRIPVSKGRRPSSVEPPVSPTTSRLPLARTASKNYFPAGSSSPKNHFPVGPTSPQSRSLTKENTSPRTAPPTLATLSTRRYDPFAHRQVVTGPSLKAVIKADPPQKSPPLRSSRPRQPVSEAATNSPRTKSGQRFESAISKKDNFRSKRKIPELGNVDFAERRARIQRAISANLPEENGSDQGSVSARSSMSSVGRPQSLLDTSITEDPPSAGESRNNRESLPPNGLGLSLEVNGRAVDSFLNGPYSATTTFDESSCIDMSQTYSSPEVPQHVPAELASEEPATLLSQVMRMRERSSSSASRTDIETSPKLSASPSLSDPDDKESIPIMLDGEPAASEPLTAKQEHFLLEPPTARQEHFPSEPLTARQEHFPLEPPTAKQEHFSSESPVTGQEQFPSISTPETENESFGSDTAEVGSSPWIGSEAEHSVPETPRKEDHLTADHIIDDDITPRQSDRVGRSTIMTISSDWDRDSDSYSAVNRILEQYQSSGYLSPEMLQEFDRHVSLLPPNISTLTGSDDGNIKALLENMLADQYDLNKQPPPESPYPATTLYSPADPGIMDSPEENFRPGTAIIYSPPSKHAREKEYESDSQTVTPREGPSSSPSSLTVNTPASQFDGQPDTISGADEEEKDFRPTPPPKDEGYSPRSSIGNGTGYQAIDQVLPKSARHSRTSMPSSMPSTVRPSRSKEILRLPEIPTGQGLGLAISLEPPSTTSSVPPPLPMHSPPPPPPPSGAAKPPELVFTDPPKNDVAVSQPSSPTVARSSAADERFRNFSTPGSRPSTARPSLDSRRKPEPISLPPSHSTSSFQSSDRGPSLDDSLTSSTQPPTPNPEHRRLLKRKHVIRELVDTEYSYHQDMKIIEDIYKGTVGEMITADDKKILFGNSDQVEAFSLEFYDALRRAVTGVYVPPKSTRWHSKRGSFSTNNSGERESSSSDPPDEERDSTSRVGECFAIYLTQMEKIYGAYLKNHDAANQRLAKLQGETTVKCWLAECHNNASDITSAWDLDSLLVKPVQRILKYPLLLRELLESTPSSHPDHKALEYSVKEIMNVTHRINEAKKRTDLVEQIVTRKRKESDVRNGIAKAFGRRTNQLKERVGIAEAYQDVDFDKLAHRFGGHYIKLQVCMRDVQGSLAEVDKAVQHFLQFADALEAYIEVSPSTNPEIESKWRKFVLAIRELATVALPDHKTKVQNHVIKPMLTAIELHKGPQNAIQKRKKRILDYAKCKTMEKAGLKADRKTIEASEQYEALNEQLKIDLPRLYSLSAELIKACLDSNVVLQTQWMWLWKEKLAPVLDYSPRPDEPDTSDPIHPNTIMPTFLADYDIVHSHTLGLSICNGSLLADAANFLSPQTTLVGEESAQPSRATSRIRRPSEMSSSRGQSRKLSIGSEHSPLLISPDVNRSFGDHLPLSPNLVSFPNGQPGFYGRMRSSSSLSANRGRTPSIPQATSANTLPSSRMPSLASKPSLSASRPATAHSRPADVQPTVSRMSVDTSRQSPRPTSGASYFTALPDNSQGRFSGMFSSAMPMADSPAGSAGPASPKHAPEDTPVMFVAASLFEFNIDRARREAGYPYLTYVEGEVFDVVAQKGELWLAKNQDDSTNSLGWIWEQHFVILSQDS